MIQALFEAVLEAFFYVVYEVLVKLPGYGLLRCFYRASEVEFDSGRATLTGLLLWAAVGGTVALIIWLN